tara:strand:+ start:282 stop:1034 length:753 start_codon:yes stop_codon:yes gene_type:complete
VEAALYLLPMINFKKLLLFVFILNFSLQAQKIRGIVFYKKEIAQSDQRGSMVFLNSGDIQNASEGLVYELKFNETEAIFGVVENMERSDTKVNSYVIRSGGGKGKYYTPLDQNYSLHQVEYVGELFLVKQNHPDFEITNETKMIGDYQCRKAIFTAVRKAPNEKMQDVEFTSIVWFTPAIPVSIGPLHLSGLPGLVLQVELGRVSYTATELNLNTEINIEIEKPEKGIPIEEKDLASTLKKMLKNLGAYN